MRIVLLGPPGSGKADIARQISDKYGFPVVDMANIAEELSATARELDDLGRQAKEAIVSGRVTDELCTVVLKQRLAKEDIAKGFVLVGYPKGVSQAGEIDSALDSMRRPLDLALIIDIDRDELMERLVGRISCDSCGAKYNLYVNPPMVEGICDFCGRRVNRRPGDYEENIANRLRIFDGLAAPLIQYYNLHGKLRHVDGNGTEAQLWEGVQNIIDATPATVLETEPVSEAAVPLERSDGEQTTGGSPVAAKPGKGKTAGRKTAARKKKAVKKSAESGQKATAGEAAGSKTKATPKKKAAAKKKVTPKDKAARNKKVASKKTAAPKKKTIAGKATAGKKVTAKKTATKKKAAPGKKAAGKKVTARKAATRKMPAAGKKVVGKKAVTKKKPAARKKAVVSKRTVKKRVAKARVSKKKTVAGKTVGKKVVKKPVVRKKAASKKKAGVKKKVTPKKLAKKKTAKKKGGSKR